MTPKELQACIRLGLVRPVRARLRKTGKGGIEQGSIEYELTHEGRVMAKQTYASKAAQYRRYYELGQKQQARKAEKEARTLEQQIDNKRVRINLLKNRLG